jgi:hypothetical protein
MVVSFLYFLELLLAQEDLKSVLLGQGVSELPLGKSAQLYTRLEVQLIS